MTQGSVQFNNAADRYELKVGERTAIAAVHQRGDTVVFTHTEVPPQLEGQGVGSRLMAGALSDVRQQGLKIVAECPFVARYVERHPEVQDLLNNR